MLDMIAMDRTGEDRKRRDHGVKVNENNWSDSPLLQCSFHLHVFIKSIWNVVSSGQPHILQSLIFPGDFLWFFSNTTPFWKMSLPQKAVVLMSGKIVTLWSHRGWNLSPRWKQRHHPQWQQRAQDVTGSAFGCCTVSWKLFGDGICVHALPCTKKSWICWPPGTAKKQMLNKLSCEQWK